jgi:3-isopropylmalate/(R)-2-methylmalate dehydratase small subunit
MDAFTTLTAVAVPLDQANIDTDQIIPARFLGRTRDRQVEGFFHDFAARPQRPAARGRDLNNPAYKGAKIIVANTNFACGSSRENAVTTMVDNGFRAFIAPSFGDIFFNNCFQNGCLAIRLPAERVARMRGHPARAAGRGDRDRPRQADRGGPDGKTDSFEIDPFRKEMLLQGADEVKITMGYEPTSSASRTVSARRCPGSDTSNPPHSYGE